MTFSSSIEAFFPYAAMVLIRLRQAHFVMRVSDQAAGFSKWIREHGTDDWLVTFHPNPATRRKDPWLPTEITARLIRYQAPGFRPSWLITSLMDVEAYAREELVDLYHRRWRIETIYREWKHGLNIQNLRAHTPIGIRKEIHAQLLLSNLVRWVMTEATQGTQATPVDLSFTTALTFIENALLVMRRAHATQLTILYQQLLRDIRSSPIRKRPGRSYPRPNDGKIKNRGHGKRQLPARITGILT